MTRAGGRPPNPRPLIDRVVDAVATAVVLGVGAAVIALIILGVLALGRVVL